MGYYKENTVLYFDGAYLNANEAHTNLYTQTLHYGYGVFEGIRSYSTANGAAIFKAEDHFIRLQKSCELLGIPMAYSVEELIEISYKVLEMNQLSDAYIRPLVICDPNMTLINGTSSRVLIAVWEWGAYLGEKLLSLKISPYCRPHPRSLHIEAKAVGHYVNSILATSDARKSGYDEALLLDCEGYLAEGPGANLFFEKDGALYTPALGHILPGITRQTVLEICAAQGIAVHQGCYTPADIYEADSAFFCGTGAEVVGIEAINGQTFKKDWPASLGSQIKSIYLKKVRNA